MNGVPAYRRPVNMVFQHYALFPHLDVAGNVSYGLRQRSPRPSRAEIDRQVAAALEMVRLPATRGAAPGSFRAASSSAWRSPAR